MKKIGQIILTSLLLISSLCINIMADENVHELNLNSSQNSDGTYSHSATLDGQALNEYDYTWHADPSIEHEEVKNSPAEYYTGTKPSESDSVYIAHDIYYYPELDTSKYVKQQYDDEVEWCYYYDIEKYQDYVFATLPVEGNDVPTRMMHSESEAYQNAVLHIKEAGTYKITGTWHGQINIDLGEDSFDDPSQVVTLILDNVNVECSVASGICFYQVYEVDNAWEDRESALTSIDTTGAGANIIIADDSTNNVSGANIYRILKTKYKSDETKVQKKALKIDGGLYSFMSLNIAGQTKGNGILNINSEFEGLDSELHLTINSANINIIADNDGINVNEDNVSIFTMNGGTLQILAGTGYEGDGIDSNGYININGGTTISSAKPQSDSGLDSDCGTYINGGTVIATGSSMDVVTEYSEDANQVTANLVFSSQQSIETSLAILDSSNKPIFAYDLSQNEFFKGQNRTYQCLIVSNEDLKVSETYSFYFGSTIKGDQTNGIYLNPSKITDGKQLSYTSTGSFGFGGMRPDNMDMSNFNPGTFNQGTKIDNMPNNTEPSQGQMSEQPQGQAPNFNGGEAPSLPEGQAPNFNGGEAPSLPEGQAPNMSDEQIEQFAQGQTNNEAPQKPNQTNNQNQTTSFEAKTEFVMEDKVNTFSGVNASTQATETSNQISTSTLIYIGVGGVLLGAVIGVLIAVIIKRKK